MFKILTLLASGLALVSAYHAPGEQVVGTNPITLPNQDTGVTVGQPFTVTFDGAGLGPKVSLLLWRGPGNNLVFLKPIADAVDNTGTFVWTPDASLDDDVTHYGIQLVSEDTGNYQWSTQFGVSNKGPKPSSSSSIPSGPSSSALKPTSQRHPPPSKSVSHPISKPTSPPSSIPSHSAPPAGGDSTPPAGGQWKPPVGGDYTPPSTGPTFSTYVAAPKPTGYTGPYTNGAGRFAFSAGSAVVALGAAVLLL